MKKSAMKKLVATLRSGEFKQAKAVLHSKKTNGRCCLGVACNVVRMKPLDDNTEDGYFYGTITDKDYMMLPLIAQKRLGMKTNSGEFKMTREFADKHKLTGRFNISKHYFENGKMFSTLSSLNDNGAPFSVIADIIEEYWEQL